MITVGNGLCAVPNYKTKKERHIGRSLHIQFEIASVLPYDRLDSVNDFADFLFVKTDQIAVQAKLAAKI